MMAESWNSGKNKGGHSWAKAIQQTDRTICIPCTSVS
jgi:hypothetical protein